MESVRGMYEMEAIAREESRVEGTWSSIDETRCFVCDHELLVEERYKLEGRVEIVFREIIQTTIDFWWALVQLSAQHIDCVDDLGHSQKRVLSRRATQFSNFDVLRKV